MNTPPVLVEAHAHVLVITLNRPEKLNALTPDMYDQLARAYYRLEHDAALRVGVVMAQGRHFTSGLELDRWAPMLTPTGFKTLEADQLDPFGMRGGLLSKPLVFAVQGLCLTAGMEMMLNADVRIAAEDASFAQIEVQRGLYPFGGATIRLQQTIGWANAQRYLLTGDSISAERALQMGLISEIVPRDTLHRHALTLAETIARRAPLGVQASLRSSKLARVHGEELAREHIFDDMQRILASEDLQEGIRSFLERRDAEFSGR